VYSKANLRISFRLVQSEQYLELSSILEELRFKEVEDQVTRTHVIII
jgi:hypothetical protein